MSRHSVIYVGNSSIIELDGLADADGNYQNDATVTLQSLVDKRTGDAVSGVTVPLSMTYVTGSDGKYQGALGYDAGVKAGRLYLATVQAISAAGLRATWSETVIALDRAD